MLFLAHWARKLSWKETAQSFHTSWEKVHQAVAYVVQWGLLHRQAGPIRAIR
jgi:transposase